MLVSANALETSALVLGPDITNARPVCYVGKNLKMDNSTWSVLFIGVPLNIFQDKQYLRQPFTRVDQYLSTVFNGLSTP